MKFTSAWHHAPPHWLEDKGIYMVTGATLHKRHIFSDPMSRDILQSIFFDCCQEFGWGLHAWALFSNHYHFVSESPDDASTLKPMLSKMHMQTAKWVNQRDQSPGRKVWFQFWDSRITFERSYWPRLRYVHENPVKHEVVRNAEEYKWCSARWFSEKASAAHRRKVLSFKTDKLKVFDEFKPI